MSSTQTDAPSWSGPAITKMSVPTLTAMVVGGMVGAGVFSLPARFGVATGVLMLAFVVQNLAVRKPELNSGVFIYAKAGFGDYAGFNSAIGFWASAVAGNTFYWVFIGATLGASFESFGDGDTILAAGLSTVGVWLFHALIARGVRDAAVINRIVTIFKVIPAAYGLKLAISGEAYEAEDPRTQRKHAIIAGVATACTAFLFVAAGLTFSLLSTVILAPLTLLYVKARSEQGRTIFTPTEAVLCVAIVAGAVAGDVGLWTGRITL